MVRTRFIPLLATCLPTLLGACSGSGDDNRQQAGTAESDGDGNGDGGLTSADPTSTTGSPTSGYGDGDGTGSMPDLGGDEGDESTGNGVSAGDSGGPGSGDEGGDGGSPLCGENPNTCNAPSDDCVCMGCDNDGMCAEEEDCICDDCDYDLYCGDSTNCNGDGFCDVVAEGCACSECMPIPACQDFTVVNSCANWCGGGPVPGSNPQCFCNAGCADAGNCCEDMCEFDVCGGDPVCTGLTQCVEDSGECIDPSNDCTCVGCIDDQLCGAGVDEDCTCNDCLGMCGCNGDFYCDVFIEDCSCSDCMGLGVCAGQGG